MQIDASGKLQVLINGKESTLQWPDKAATKLPINREVYPLVSFPKGMQGRVELQGRSGIGLSLAEQELRKKLQGMMFDAMACGQCCAARLAFGAVETKNPTLLRTMKEYAVPVNTQMSADNLYTPLEAAVLSNDVALVRELLADQAYKHSETAPFPPNTIARELDTGVVSAHTFNHRVGPIGVARGGKQGDTAFIAWYR